MSTSPPPPRGILHTAGSHLVDAGGAPVRLRGVCIGGWMNMENFITGYAGNESLMRSAVLGVLGQDRYDLFFDRLLTGMFADADAQLLADTGLNSVRLGFNYRHFEDDARPFVIKEEGFRHLDRAIEACARHGIWSVLDLHAVQGYQNHHWHSDNPTHRASLFDHPHFQDRLVRLWEVIADRYRDNHWVAGYNLINEPADESRRVIGPLCRRIVEAIRAVDSQHVIFLDGNTYATEFDVFEALGEPFDNAVYTLHDYGAPGLGHGGPYPGLTRGTYFDKDVLEEKFLARSDYSRRTGTPIWVGEFGVIYTGDESVDEPRRQLLDDQLEIYKRHDAGWALWMYKDLGRQGLAGVRPDTAYRRRFDPFVEKKTRLGADQWGSHDDHLREVIAPLRKAWEAEFPTFTPYPWGQWDWLRTLVLNLAFAQPLVHEYADLFRGLDDSELLALADSFALSNCDVRTRLADQLQLG